MAPHPIADLAVWPWAEANAGLIAAVALVSALAASVSVFWLERSGDRRRAEASAGRKRQAANLMLDNAIVLCDLADDHQKRFASGYSAVDSVAAGTELLRELGPLVTLNRELLAQSFDDPLLMFALAEVQTCFEDLNLQWTRLRDLQILAFGAELVERNRSVLLAQKMVLSA